MQVVGDVKCYHCGHVSGQVEGSRGDRLIFQRFNPRSGYKGAVPGPGATLRCERCQGPVYVEDLKPLLPSLEPLLAAMPRKRGRASRGKAA